MKAIHLDSFDCIKTPDFANYARQYVEIESGTHGAIAQFGLDFDASEASARENDALRKRLRSEGRFSPTATKAFTLTGYQTPASPAERERPATRPFYP